MSNLLEQASLVMIPSGYAEDIVYSEIPLDGSGDLQLTRASNGTRVNSAGLVEVTPWNIVQESETFSNAIWNLYYATITSNSQTAPNGTLTADTLNSTTSQYSGIYQSLGTLPTNVYTYSIYVKAGTNNFFGMLGQGTGSQIAIFNLSTGVVSSISNLDSASIESVGNGWFRCQIQKTGAGVEMLIFSSNIANSVPTASGTVYLWGAQVNIGSTAKPYFPTTDRLNVPRLTYQNGGGGCPSLLLEKQSTNVFVESENLFTTHLVQNLTTSGYSNIATSPDGTQNANKFVPNSTSGVHGIANGSLLTITSGQAYSFSAFVKSDGGAYNLISLTFDSATAWGATKNCIFNASTGASYSVPSGATMSSQDMGNGWYRITATLTATGTVSSSLYQYRIYIADANGNLSWAASSGNTSGIFVWGAQLEASSYATSYIPTTSASATRVADECYKTNLSGLSSQSELTLYTEFIFEQNGRVIAIGDGSTNNRCFISYSNTKEIQFYLTIGGTNKFFLTSSTNLVLNGKNKVAAKIKSGASLLYLNGVEIFNDTTTFTLANLSNLYIGTNEFGVENNIQKIGESIIFYSSLTSSELASLTTI